MADNTTIQPPPQPMPQGDVPRTLKERVGGFLQGLAGSTSGMGSESIPLANELQRSHQERQYEAEFNWHKYSTYLGLSQLPVGSPNPQDGKPITQQDLDKWKAWSQDGLAKYTKVMSVNKEAKQKIAAGVQRVETIMGLKKRMSAQSHGSGSVQTQQPQQTKPGSTTAPPPQPSGKASEPTPGGGAAPSAVQPPPKPPVDQSEGNAMLGSAAQGVAEQHAHVQRMREADDKFAAWQREEKFKTDEKIREDKEKIEAQKEAKIAEDKAKPPKPGENQADKEDRALLNKGMVAQRDANGKLLGVTPLPGYEEFQQRLTKAKQGTAKNAGFMTMYAVYRLIEAGYRENPALLKYLGPIAASAFKNAGMNVPDGFTEALSQLPPNMPENEFGEAIGTKMPGAPTESIKTAGLNAQRVLTEIPNTRKQVEALRDSLGPINGRVVAEFLQNKVGSTGDPALDRALQTLRLNLSMVGSGAGRFHLNSVRYTEHLDKLSQMDHLSPDALLGFLDGVESWARDTARQGIGKTIASPTALGTEPPPKAKSDTIHYVEGGDSWDIPSGKEKAFQKAHPNAKRQ